MPGERSPGSANPGAKSSKHLDDDLIFNFINGLVDENEKQSVDEHLSFCHACSNEVAAITKFALHGLPAKDEVELPRYVNVDVETRLKEIFKGKSKESIWQKILDWIWPSGTKVLDWIPSIPPSILKPAAAFASVVILYLLIGRPIYNDRQSKALSSRALTSLTALAGIETRNEPRPQGGFKFGLSSSGPTRGAHPPQRGPENIAENDIAAIKKDLQEAITLNNGNAAAHRYLGTYYLFVERDLPKAREQYLLALRQDSTNAAIQNDAGVAAWHAKAYADAIKNFSAALRLDSRFLEAQYNLATVYQTLGREEQARREWEKYLRADSASTWAGIAREHLEPLPKE